MRYKKLTGVILKKQNYKEADQILTVWTRQAGKVRLLAKSLRLPKSKLASSLTELTVVEMEAVGHKNLPTVISAQCKKNYRSFRDDLVKTGSAFYAGELMMKMTADEHPNEPAFNLMVEFLEKLDEVELIGHYSLIDKFALDLAEILGFGRPQIIRSHADVRNFIENLIERSLKSESLLKQLA